MDFTLKILVLLLACLLSVEIQAQNDPTIPWSPVSKHHGLDTGQTAIVVQTILYSATRRFALINGKLLHENDIVDGYKLLKINVNDVVMEKNKKQERFKIFVAQPK